MALGSLRTDWKIKPMIMKSNQCILLAGVWLTRQRFLSLPGEVRPLN